jgi:hypothetical protein
MSGNIINSQHHHAIHHDVDSKFPENHHTHCGSAKTVVSLLASAIPTVFRNSFTKVKQEQN